jgi:hypothetical protein
MRFSLQCEDITLGRDLSVDNFGLDITFTRKLSTPHLHAAVDHAGLTKCGSNLCAFRFDAAAASLSNFGITIDNDRSVGTGGLGAFGTKIGPSLSGGGDVRPKGRNGWQKGRRGR